MITFIVDCERFEENLDRLTASRTATAQCRVASKVAELAKPAAFTSDLAVRAVAWNRLDTLAKLTFAPATEASRQAGAGESDNN